MRINHNISSMITQGALYGVNVNNNKTLEKLSTGLRINRASDDAAGLAVSENLRTQVNGLAMAKRNAQDGIALLQIAEGGMNEISSLMQRMRELAVQSSNDTLTDTERAYTDQEYQQLTLEVDRIVNTSLYNRQTLLDGNGFGSGGSDQLHIGPNAVADADMITVTINPVSTSDLGIDGGDLLTHDDAVTAIDALDAGIDILNAERSNVGAYVNRLEHAVNNMMNQQTNTQAAESVIRDVDFASETASYTRNQILTESATAMLAQANMLPQNMLTLLK
jgi:flagellin